MCLASLLLLATVVPGCGDDNNDVADNAEQEGTEVGIQLASLADSEMNDQTDAVSMGMAAQIMLVIDQGEIAQAQVALPKLTDPAAIEYANTMIIEHTDHIEDVQALIVLEDIDLIDTETSAALQASSDATVRDLASFAAPLDFEYIRSQVVNHSTALEVVDELSNNIDDFTFFDFVNNTADLIDQHKQTAADILRTY